MTWEGAREQREKERERAERAAEEDRVGLLISEQCQHTIREFLGYKEEHVGKSAADDHCLDSLRYACMGVAGGTTGLRVRKARVNVHKGAMLPEDRK